MSTKRSTLIFDIDGTLTDSYHVDDDIYPQAFAEHLQLKNFVPDWESYEFCTDSGVAMEIFQTQLGRVYDPAEIEAVKQRYFALLAEKLQRSPESCRPIAGAEGLFEQLRAAGYQVGIATGAWRESAKLKLQHAGIEHAGLPFACGDDALARPDIIRLAIERVEQHNGLNAEQVIYVGDGAWDYRAAQSLGIGFIGVGDKLSRAGIVCPIIKNYQQNDLLALITC